ncbi:MAG: O-succinylhomoserine sulfhydrylase [Burkholderiaceae bacterium]|nr:O-succinylhomoserine sulfhydrylase [Burkholderiaceae bacterium]
MSNTTDRDPLAAGLHPQTLAVREAMPASQYGENSEALFLTSCYRQPDSETCAARFAATQPGYTYTRTSNPTVESFERRLAALEGSEAAIGTSSGMAAILMLCLALLKAGDHVVCSRSVFGSTIGLLGKEFAKFGVETTFVAQTDLQAWRAAIRPEATRLLFAETPTNPLTEVCDIRALADLARNAHAQLVVDNTFCTPVLQRPLELGADMVMHSGTKFLDGQGRVLAGAVCCTAQLVREQFMPMVRTAGMALSPFNAWVVLKGMETLALRVKAQSEQALQLASWLQQHPAVSSLHYPGLPSHPQHQLAMRQQSGAGGSVLAFTVKGHTPEELRRNAFHVIDSTRLLTIAANLGDTKTIITHPASTSHGRLSEEVRQAAGITQGLIRIAVGLEHLDDIKADLLRGLDTLK